MSIYLDNASTTRPKYLVKQAVADTLEYDWGNPSNLYKIGQEAKDIIIENKQKISECIGCKPNEIFFVSCASEGNAWALKQAEWFAYSAFEHHSVDLNPQAHFKMDDDEFLAGHNMECSGPHWGYAHVLVNSETGIIFPVLDLFQEARNRGMFTFCDMTQALGNIEIAPYLQSGLIDMAVFSLHKLGGPKGIGFVYIREEVQSNIKPLIYGSQESGLRGGTENVPYISASGETVHCATNSMWYKQDECRIMRDIVLKKLADSGIDYAVNSMDPYNGENIWATLNFSVKGVSSELIQKELADKYEIYIGVGSACNTGLMEKDKVMEALGVPDEYAMGQIRLSFNPDDAESEIEYAVDKIIEVYKSLI